MEFLQSCYEDQPEIEEPAKKQKVSQFDEEAIESNCVMLLDSGKHGEEKPITRLRWIPTEKEENRGCFVTSSLDGRIILWDISREKKLELKEIISLPTSIKDFDIAINVAAICCMDGTMKLLDISQEKSVFAFDIQKQLPTTLQNSVEYFTCCRFHPRDQNVVIVGTNLGKLFSIDTKSDKVVTVYDSGNREGGQVQSIEFTKDASTVISSCDVSSKSHVDKGIVVFDYKSGGILSNQPYVEFYSCTDIKLHPEGRHFVAQSNGNYAAIFKTAAPFKLNKHKRFGKHLVNGFPIHFGFSEDGSVLVSGSSNGCAYLYDWNTTQKLAHWKAHHRACVEVQIQPTSMSFEGSKSSLIATGSWDSTVKLWETLW